MSRHVFKAPVIVRNVTTLVDGGVKLTVATRELHPVEMAALFAVRGSEAWMLLSPNDEADESQIPTTQAHVEAGEKTPSQRLRGVLYRLWEQTSQSMAFELYYKIKMEKFVDSVKQELEP